MARGKIGKNKTNNSTSVKCRKTQAKSETESQIDEVRSKTWTTVSNGKITNKSKRSHEDNKS